MSLVRKPAPLSTSGCPATSQRSSNVTPATTWAAYATDGNVDAPNRPRANTIETTAFITILDILQNRRTSATSNMLHRQCNIATLQRYHPVYRIPLPCNDRLFCQPFTVSPPPR